MVGEWPARSLVPRLRAGGCPKDMRENGKTYASMVFVFGYLLGVRRYWVAGDRR